jgi:type IX secretion system PorP/SprF family membrane protein
MRYILLFVAFCISHASLRAQEDPLYAQYLNNPFVINPAYAGLNNVFNATVSYRKQWGGFEGSPSTAGVTVHTSLQDNKMGLGLMFVQDKTGSTKNSEAYATYAYRLHFGEKYLSFGLQGGFINFRDNNALLNPYDPNDPAFSGNQSVVRASIGAGIILNSERFFIGLSVPRMLKPTTMLSDVTTELYSQHLYLMGAYVFYLSERFRFKPSVLLKGVQGAPISTDYNLSFNLDEKYSVAVFSRNFNTYGVLTQIKFGGAYRFGYSFEVPTNKSVGTRFSTHEIMFGLNLALLSFHDTYITNF